MFNRKLGIVDLSKKKISIKQTPDSLKKLFLGGRGLNSYYLYKMIKPGIDPFSPENLLIFGTGFLTGTLVPNSSRFNVSAKSPETGILGDSNCGGYFGPEIKKCGFDAIIIKGMSDTPKYVSIIEGTKQILDASELWGLDAVQTEEKLLKKHGKVQIASIGQSGEKLSLISGSISSFISIILTLNNTSFSASSFLW